MSQLVVRKRSVVDRFEVAALNVKRPRVVNNRRLKVPLLPVAKAAVVVKIRVVWEELNRTREVSDRTIELKRSIVRDAAVVMGVWIPWLDRKRPGVVRNRFVEALQLILSEAAIEKRFEVRGRQGDRFGVLLDRTREITLLSQRKAAAVVVVRASGLSLSLPRRRRLHSAGTSPFSTSLPRGSSSLKAMTIPAHRTAHRGRRRARRAGARRHAGTAHRHRRPILLPPAHDCPAQLCLARPHVLIHADGKRSGPLVAAGRDALLAGRNARECGGLLPILRQRKVVILNR